MRQRVEEGPQGELDLTMPAEPASVPVLRHRAAEYAAEQGVDQPVVDDVALAVSEAVTNAVKYADAAEADGVVELGGAPRDGWLEVTVRDRGEGFGKGSTDGLGLGLSIIARLCSELTIVQEGDGTEVRMRFPLPSSA
ncbi:MAG TPA: ATP-binding protein [Solirubrobacterales bacterium]|nr:ATP-binding protein [Solirubrobacterales bacterium]